MLHLKSLHYSPILKTHITYYSIVSSGTYRSWSRVNSLNLLTHQGMRYIVGLWKLLFLFHCGKYSYHCSSLGMVSDIATVLVNIRLVESSLGLRLHLTITFIVNLICPSFSLLIHCLVYQMSENGGKMSISICRSLKFLVLSTTQRWSVYCHRGIKYSLWRSWNKKTSQTN